MGGAALPLDWSTVSEVSANVQLQQCIPPFLFPLFLPPSFPPRVPAYPVEEEEGGEVGCLVGVQHVQELGTEDGVRGCEPATREDTELEELRDGTVLGHL